MHDVGAGLRTTPKGQSAKRPASSPADDPSSSHPKKKHALPSAIEDTSSSSSAVTAKGIQLSLSGQKRKAPDSDSQSFKLSESKGRSSGSKGRTSGSSGNGSSSPGTAQELQKLVPFTLSGKAQARQPAPSKAARAAASALLSSPPSSAAALTTTATARTAAAESASQHPAGQLDMSESRPMHMAGDVPAAMLSQQSPKDLPSVATHATTAHGQLPGSAPVLTPATAPSQPASNPHAGVDAEHALYPVVVADSGSKPGALPAKFRFDLGKIATPGEATKAETATAVGNGKEQERDTAAGHAQSTTSRWTAAVPHELPPPPPHQQEALAVLATDLPPLPPEEDEAPLLPPPPASPARRGADGHEAAQPASASAPASAEQMLQQQITSPGKHASRRSSTSSGVSRWGPPLGSEADPDLKPIPTTKHSSTAERSSDSTAQSHAAVQLPEKPLESLPGQQPVTRRHSSASWGPPMMDPSSLRVHRTSPPTQPALATPAPTPVDSLHALGRAAQSTAFPNGIPTDPRCPPSDPRRPPQTGLQVPPPWGNPGPALSRSQANSAPGLAWPSAPALRAPPSAPPRFSWPAQTRTEVSTPQDSRFRQVICPKDPSASMQTSVRTASRDSASPKTTRRSDQSIEQQHDSSSSPRWYVANPDVSDTCRTSSVSLQYRWSQGSAVCDSIELTARVWSTRRMGRHMAESGESQLPTPVCGVVVIFLCCLTCLHGAQAPIALQAHEAVISA